MLVIIMLASLLLFLLAFNTMAVLKAPLMSFDARGKLANSLVFMGWKGLKTVRQHVTPANPQTADQVTQRDKVTSGVSAWKNYFTNAVGRASWNRIALVYAGAMSGFNAFMKNVLGIIATTADASFANGAAAAVDNKAAIYMVNIDDGDGGDEAGNFEIWTGTNTTNLTLFESIAIAADQLTTSDLGDVDDVVYIKVRKGGYDRSGIFVITLIA